MYVRGYLQGSENGRVVTIGKLQASLLPVWVATPDVNVNTKLQRHSR